MIQWLAGTQPVVVAVVLAWASAFKLLSRSAPMVARRSALRRLVGTDRVVAAYRLLGVVEFVLAAALILPPAHPAEALAAVMLSVGMLGYLGYARLVAPESSCGCLGAKHAPVRWRSVARAGLLTVAGGFPLLGSGWWATVALDRPFATIGVVVAELALVVMLSPELDRSWLFPLRRFKLRMSHPLAGQPLDVPLDSTVQQLHKSDAYRSVADLIRSDLLDTWDEGEWRILTYSARRESGPAAAVFAVPRLEYRPDAVRAVPIADSEERAPV